jgi:RNA polymerase sigma-70 factor (ECF subfamily)
VETDVEDSVLVSRAQQGHVDAFEVLVHRYSPTAYRVALRIVADHHDAQEVTQDALLSMWRGLPQFRADASISTWLYQIVTRAALNKATRNPHRKAVEIPTTLAATTEGPAEHVTRTQSTASVVAAVATLPAAQRVAVILHHFEGLSYAAVAEVTDTTVPAVRSHLFRARRTLTSTLGEWK